VFFNSHGGDLVSNLEIKLLSKMLNADDMALVDEQRMPAEAFEDAARKPIKVGITLKSVAALRRLHLVPVEPGVGGPNTYNLNHICRWAEDWLDATHCALANAEAARA
jgi:hypothetical protein